MRKRSSYRPKRNFQDPLNWVLNGMRPVTVAADVIMTLRIANHSAIEAVRKGEADWEAVSALVIAFNIATALAIDDLGAEYAAEIKEALLIALDLEHRPKYLLRGGELAKINLGMEIHDAQIDACSVARMEEAMKFVKKVVDMRKHDARRTKQLEPA